MSLSSLVWTIVVSVSGVFLLILAICLNPTKKEESK